MTKEKFHQQQVKWVSRGDHIPTKIDVKRTARQEGAFRYLHYRREVEIPDDIPVHKCTPEEDERAKKAAREAHTMRQRKQRGV